MGGSRTHPYANARQVLAVEFAVVFEFVAAVLRRAPLNLTLALPRILPP